MMASTIPLSLSSYQTLAREISALEPMAEAGRLEDAARFMSMLAAQLAALPVACESDRTAIERALSQLSALDERLRPLCGGDIDHLHSMFGTARKCCRAPVTGK